MLWLESVIGTVVWCWCYYDITVLHGASIRKTTQEKGTASNG